MPNDGGRTSPSPKNPGYRPPVASVAPRMSGVLANDQAPLPAAAFSATDEWSGPSTSPSRWLYVYAG